MPVRTVAISLLSVISQNGRNQGGRGAKGCNSVASGQWQRRADAAGQPEEELYRQMVKNTDIPLGRVGRSEEFADLAAYLLSDRSSYVTGSAVNLDGGSSPVL